MTLRELDRRLDRLRGAAEQIRDSLVEVELDPSRRLLDELDLQGQTERRWLATSAALMQVWEWHAQLASLLERAVALRGGRARLRHQTLAELKELVTSPSIDRVTPDELVDRMSAGIAEANAVLAQVAAAWDTFGSQLRVSGDMLTESAKLYAQLGEAEADEVAVSRRRLGELTGALAKDPLSASNHDVDALEASVLELRAGIDAIIELRNGIGERLADARALLEEVQRAQQDADAARAEVLAKIVAPALSKPVGLTGLDAELEQVVEICEAGTWRRASDALEQWTAAARSLLGEAQRVAADHRAAIDARNQLRGRLDAYKAKARQLGLIEDPELWTISERAQDALYTAPTDLEHAEELLLLYRQALQDLSAGMRP